MNLDRYKSQLNAIAADLTKIGATNGASLFARWARAAEALQTAPSPNLKLQGLVQDVQRSAQAIVILASERYLQPTALGNPQAARLESTLHQLLDEAASISSELNKVRDVLLDPGLPAIVNDRLTAVAFVLDYVELHIHCSTLRAFTSPEVHEAAARYRAIDPGYRDALCRRIGSTVRSVELREHEQVAIFFEDEISIRVSLREEDRTGPESAIFSSKSGGLWVW